MKNQKLKRLLKETVPSAEMQPHDDMMLLNQDELNLIGGTQCGTNFCIFFGGPGCGNNTCTGNT